jgi:hypothetical protein
MFEKLYTSMKGLLSGSESIAPPQFSQPVPTPLESSHPTHDSQAYLLTHERGAFPYVAYVWVDGLVACAQPGLEVWKSKNYAAVPVELVGKIEINHLRELGADCLLKIVKGVAHEWDAFITTISVYDYNFLRYSKAPDSLIAALASQSEISDQSCFAEKRIIRLVQKSIAERDPKIAANFVVAAANATVELIRARKGDMAVGWEKYRQGDKLLRLIQSNQPVS